MAIGLETGAVIGHLVAGVAGLIAGSVASSFGYAALGGLFAAASAVMVVAIAFTRDPRMQGRFSVRPSRGAAAGGELSQQKATTA
jgi:hypothetical protein